MRIIVLFSLILLFSLGHCANFLRVDTPASSASFQELVDWLTRNGLEVNGKKIEGSYDLPFELYDFPDTGRGIRAKSDIAIGYNLFTLPAHLAFSSQTQSRTPRGSKVLQACRQHFSSQGCHPEISVLIFALAYEHSLANQSMWAPFLRLLPDAFPTHLISMGQFEESSPYFSKYFINHQYQTDINTLYVYAQLADHLKAQDPDLFPEDVFSTSAVFWAWRAVSSRTFDWAQDGVEGKALLPLCDLFNHQHDAPVVSTRVSTEASQTASYAFDTLLPLRKGDQIFLRYFEQDHSPSLSVLSFFGFVPHHGPAALRLQLDWSQNYEQAISALFRPPPSTSNVNATAVNATAVNATAVNATAVNATAVNATAVNGSVAGGRVDPKAAIAAKLSALVSDSELNAASVAPVAHDPTLMVTAMEEPRLRHWLKHFGCVGSREYFVSNPNVGGQPAPLPSDLMTCRYLYLSRNMLEQLAALDHRSNNSTLSVHISLSPQLQRVALNTYARDLRHLLRQNVLRSVPHDLQYVQHLLHLLEKVLSRLVASPEASPLTLAQFEQVEAEHAYDGDFLALSSWLGEQDVQMRSQVFENASGLSEQVAAVSLWQSRWYNVASLLRLHSVYQGVIEGQLQVVAQRIQAADDQPTTDLLPELQQRIRALLTPSV